MADSPATSVPLEPAEQEILDKVLAVRDQLTLLKSDKTTYVRSQDVISLYERLVEQIRATRELRGYGPEATLDEWPDRKEPTRLDLVIENGFQLISLFFLTIGRNHEAPALYSLSLIMKRLLSHLLEAGIYSAKDLDSIEKQIKVMRDDIDNSGDAYSPNLLNLLTRRLDYNQGMLNELKLKVPKLCSALNPTFEKMVSILRSMAALNTRCVYPTREMQNFLQELKTIEASRVDGNFLDGNGNVGHDQDKMQMLLERCLKVAELSLQRKGFIEEDFRDVYERLRCIRNRLEKITLTQAWSLRETDLYNFQRDLDMIDKTRVDGQFVNSKGQPAEIIVQRTLLYLIRRSYAFIYALLLASEPVSEALLPIYNQLSTLRRCLMEVKGSGGVSSTRELYPYSMKLASIDNMRKNGKFMVGNDIPEGQGSVSNLLAECYDAVYELRVMADEKSDNTVPENVTKSDVKGTPSVANTRTKDVNGSGKGADVLLDDADGADMSEDLAGLTLTREPTKSAA